MVTPEAVQKVQRTALIIGVVGLLAFSTVAVLAYQRFNTMGKGSPLGEAVQEEDEPEEPETSAARKVAYIPETRDATKTTTASAPVTASTKLTEPVLPAPGGYVATAPVNFTPAPASTSTSVRATATTPVQTPSASAAPAMPAITGDASFDFKAWVNAIKIGGVRGGDKPRILLGKGSFNVGEIINPELGISFDGYDAATHMVRFKDKTGATLERKDR